MWMQEPRTPPSAKWWGRNVTFIKGGFIANCRLLWTSGYGNGLVRQPHEGSWAGDDVMRAMIQILGNLHFLSSWHEFRKAFQAGILHEWVILRCRQRKTPVFLSFPSFTRECEGNGLPPHPQDEIQTGFFFAKKKLSWLLSLKLDLQAVCWLAGVGERRETRCHSVPLCGLWSVQKGLGWASCSIWRQPCSVSLRRPSFSFLLPSLQMTEALTQMVPDITYVCLLCARHCFKCLVCVCVNSFNPHSSPVRLGLLLTPFSKLRLRGVTCTRWDGWWVSEADPSTGSLPLEPRSLVWPYPLVGEDLDCLWPSGLWGPQWLRSWRRLSLCTQHSFKLGSLMAACSRWSQCTSLSI